MDKIAWGVPFTPALLLPQVMDGAGPKSSGTLAGKLRLKLLHPARGIHKALLPGECRVGIHRDIAEEHVVVHPVDIFRLFGTGGGKGVKLLTG